MENWFLLKEAEKTVDFNLIEMQQNSDSFSHGEVTLRQWKHNRKQVHVAYGQLAVANKFWIKSNFLIWRTYPNSSIKQSDKWTNSTWVLNH